MAFERYSRAGILLYALPLYAGPVLAPLAEVQMEAIPLFAGCFTALVVLTRPQADRLAGRLVQLVFALLINTLMCAAIYSVGFGVARLLPLSPLPFWLPFLSSGFGVALGVWRYRWTDEQAEMEAFLDDATEQIRSQMSEHDED